MATQAGLATVLLQVRLRLELGVALLLDDDIGLNALGLDRPVRRRVVAGRGETDRAVGSERDDGLDRTLAERPRADDGGALVVLQCTGDDFRSRCRAAVDQDDDRLAVGRVTRTGLGTLRFLV